MPSHEKLTTGVIGLDVLIEGGYPSESVILVVGSALSGIENIGRQFWEEQGREGSYLMIDAQVEEGMVDARDLTPDALPSHYKGDRVVVDSFSSLILRFGVGQALDCLKTARDEATRGKKTIMFLMYNNVHKPEEENLLYRLADVLLELKVVMFANEIERQLAVHKLKRATVPKRLIPFNITDKGIELSTTSRVV